MAFSFEAHAYMTAPSTSFLGMQYDPMAPAGAPTSADYGSMHQRVMAIFFNTMSTRNAGFSTIDISVLQSSTTNTYNVMMFIGSVPGSTAGGIRTTTLFIAMAAIFQFVRGRKETEAFKRAIPAEVVRAAFVLIVVSVGLVFASAIAIQSIESSNATQEY